jgi:hypothetical protein
VHEAINEASTPVVTPTLRARGLILTMPGLPLSLSTLKTAKAQHPPMPFRRVRRVPIPAGLVDVSRGRLRAKRKTRLILFLGAL